MPEPVEALRDPAPIFAALGDPTRLELVSRLGDGQSHSIAHLSDGLGLTRQGVTKHLRVLESAGIVRSSKVGRESRFRFEPGRVRQAQSYLESVSRQWDAALRSLQDFVES